MKVPVKWLKEYVDIPDLNIFTDKMSMIGHMLDKVEEKATDTVVDLELRGNRADCFGIIGIARETHACFGGHFDIPKVSPITKDKFKDFSVEIKSPAVKRFYSVIIKGIKVGPAPEFVKESLVNYGMESINNIVDITNYVMIESGMPLHAFDLKKIPGGKLILRAAREGESVVTFDGGILKLSAEDTVFAAADSPLGIAGIIGGKSSGIENDTTDILLECAGYDRVAIRKSMARMNIQTEAGLRHSHVLSSSLCDYSLERAVFLIMKYGSSQETVICGSDDYYPEPEKNKRIIFNTNETQRLGGVKVNKLDQKNILESLEFNVDQSNDRFEVTVPLFRTDIFESADLIEEILRIWGYEKIPSKILSSVIPDPIIQKELVLEEESRDIFSSLGLDEVITVPMVTKDLLIKTKDPLIERAIALVNPPTSEHSHMRTNMYATLLEAAKKVMDRGDESAKFFEIGKIYLKKEASTHKPPHKPEFPYTEIRKMAGLLISKVNKISFYDAKGIIEEYFNKLNIEVRFHKSDDLPFSTSAHIMKDDLIIGSLGLIDKSISFSNFGIKAQVYGFDIDIDVLSDIPKKVKSYMPFSEYPAVKQDMSVLVDNSVEAQNIIDMIKKTAPLVHEIEIADVYIIEEKKSLLFKLTYQDNKRTLATQEVNEIHLQIENALQKEFNAVIRGREEANKIIVGEILSVDKHPNADKLVICQVNVGDKTVQIVTGASNMKAGDRVPVALPGTQVPGLKDESGNSVIMKVAKLRGIESYGMMLAADELGVGTDHAGLLILDNNLKAGDIFNKS